MCDRPFGQMQAQARMSALVAWRHSPYIVRRTTTYQNQKGTPVRWLILILTFAIAACDLRQPVTGPNPDTGAAATPKPRKEPTQPTGPGLSEQDFAEVVAAIRPVATQVCRRRTTDTTCDFTVVINRNDRDERRAYQRQDKNGRPVLTFTTSLIASLRNRDELAFILGHEAAHHIAGHLHRERQYAIAGAAALAGLAKSNGDSAAKIAKAKKAGATIGARTFSKEFELEADELGARIAHRAGFNPLIGAQFFNTIPDPGDQFLGTHPPTSDRLAAVRRVSAQLGIRE